MTRASFFRDHYVWSYLAGGIFVALMGPRFSVAPLAWIAYSPFLAPLFISGGKKRHLLLLAFVVAALHATIAKMITAPVTWLMVPLFALPASLILFAALACAGWVYRRLGARWGVYLFAAAIIAFEWMQYTFTELSSWGALAFTQVQDLPLVQVASLFGIAGVSLLVALGSSLAAAMLAGGGLRLRFDLAAYLVIVLAAHFYGEIRLARDAPGVPIRVAAVASPFAAEETMALMQDPESARTRDPDLWARTRRAADLGAKIIVWNEMATIVQKADEPAFIEQGKALAAGKRVDLVMAYGVLQPPGPLPFENKYLWIRANGLQADEYLKRHPVPGEGSIRGKNRAQVIAFPEGGVSGAICYDYDFPEIALSNVRRGAGLAVIPSSDWRGIDPLHSDMARFMGVATGMSLLRSVRSATSFASDPFGRVKASMRFSEPGDGVMIAAVPAVPAPTLYARTGDVLPRIAAAFALLVLGATAWKTRRKAQVKS